MTRDRPRIEYNGCLNCKASWESIIVGAGVVICPYCGERWEIDGKGGWKLMEIEQ